MGTMWIELKSQTRAMNTIWSMLFHKPEPCVSSVYYLELLFYLALKSSHFVNTKELPPLPPFVKNQRLFKSFLENDKNDI